MIYVGRLSIVQTSYRYPLLSWVHVCKSHVGSRRQQFNFFSIIYIFIFFCSYCVLICILPAKTFTAVLCSDVFIPMMLTPHSYIPRASFHSHFSPPCPLFHSELTSFLKVSSKTINIFCKAVIELCKGYKWIAQVSGTSVKSCTC